MMKRYIVGTGYSDSFNIPFYKIYEDEKGDLVLYEDAIKEINILKQEIQRLRSPLTIES